MTRLVRHYKRQCSVALTALPFMLPSSALAVQHVDTQCTRPNESAECGMERGWTRPRHTAGTGYSRTRPLIATV